MISILSYLLDLKNMAVNGGSEDLVECWAGDVIECVEAVCVLSLFKHRCLSSWALRTLQGQTARSEEIKNKRVPDCHVCWDWALITLSLSCQDHDDDNCVLCPLTRIIEYPESWGRDSQGSCNSCPCTGWASELHYLSENVIQTLLKLSVSVAYKVEVTETCLG